MECDENENENENIENHRVGVNTKKKRWDEKR